MGGAGDVEAASAGKALGDWERGKGEEKWYLRDAGIKPALLGFAMRTCEPVSGHRGGVVGTRSRCWERTGNTVGASETATCFRYGKLTAALSAQ